MNCPVDGTTLLVTDRSGVEIDYCPQCCGVWLDRGELDKIIDRSASASGTAAPVQGAREQHGHGERPRKKRGGFLEDLFDF